MDLIEEGTSADGTVESNYLDVDSDFEDAEDEIDYESEEDMQVDIDGLAPSYL